MSILLLPRVTLHPRRRQHRPLVETSEVEKLLELGDRVLRLGLLGGRVSRERWEWAKVEAREEGEGKRNQYSTKRGEERRRTYDRVTDRPLVRVDLHSVKNSVSKPVAASRVRKMAPLTS